MKPINQYPISSRYGATYYPWSPAYPHRGNDRAASCGTPILIEGVKIGLVGTTGKSSGCHLHTQAGRDFYAQTTINPTLFEFKPGKVVLTGTASEWGNYVIIQVGTVYIVYAHLSKILAKKGQVIKKATKPKEPQMLAGKSIAEWHRIAVRNHNTAVAAQKSAKHYRERTIEEKNKLAALKKEFTEYKKNNSLEPLQKDVKELQGRLDRQTKQYDKEVTGLQNLNTGLSDELLKVEKALADCVKNKGSLQPTSKSGNMSLLDRILNWLGAKK